MLFFNRTGSKLILKELKNLWYNTSLIIFLKDKTCFDCDELRFRLHSASIAAGLCIAAKNIFCVSINSASFQLFLHTNFKNNFYYDQDSYLIRNYCNEVQFFRFLALFLKLSSQLRFILFTAHAIFTFISSLNTSERSVSDLDDVTENSDEEAVEYDLYENMDIAISRLHKVILISSFMNQPVKQDDV